MRNNQKARETSDPALLLRAWHGENPADYSEEPIIYLEGVLDQATKRQASEMPRYRLVSWKIHREKGSCNDRLLTNQVGLRPNKRTKGDILMDVSVCRGLKNVGHRPKDGITFVGYAFAKSCTRC